MRVTAALFPAKNLLKHFHHSSGGGGGGGGGYGKGILATSSPIKHENHKTGEEKAGMSARADPIVAFSRPPPLPPVLGPLVVLSLFEAWTSRDNNDG